jgi:hypothetical protein
MGGGGSLAVPNCGYEGGEELLHAQDVRQLHIPPVPPALPACNYSENYIMMSFGANRVQWAQA